MRLCAACAVVKPIRRKPEYYYLRSSNQADRIDSTVIIIIKTQLGCDLKV